MAKAVQVRDPGLVGKVRFGAEMISVLRRTAPYKPTGVWTEIGLIFTYKDPMELGNVVSALALGDALEQAMVPNLPLYENEVSFAGSNLIVTKNMTRFAPHEVLIEVIRNDEHVLRRYLGSCSQAYVLGRMIRNVAKGL